MLLVNEPDKLVVNKVEPKNIPADTSSQWEGCNFSQPTKVCTIIEGRTLLVSVSTESEEKGYWKALLVMAHSTDQNKSINAAIVRNKATLGTSTYEIRASEIEYSWFKNIRGTRKTADNHRHSMAPLIAGSKDEPGMEARLA